jgi:formate dehydrogenase (NADP+) alpha subunit
MADEITITIDGVEIKTQSGKMVLEAAIEAGIYIPYLCYHTGMKPFAACRMCVVAVEGGRGYPASCTLPVQDGMKVRSESSDVNELRRSVMEMLIAEHPNGCLTCHRIDLCGPNDICLRHVSVNDRCVTCPKNERCEFKDTVRYLEMELESPLNYKYRQIPLEVSDPFYDRDYNLCITCGRCVRVCEEVRGDDAICFTERSGKALVGTSYGTSLLESGCEFCGACIDVCPVGALVERDHKWEKARQVERTICPHCPVGCQLNLEINSLGRVIRSIPEINSPANHGQACYKGKFGLEFVNRTERLRHPLIRRDGRLEEATWDEALDYIAARLQEYKEDSFALLASPNSTNEECYLAQKFARVVMNTNNVDQTSNTQPELTIGLERSLGYGAATNPIWELEQTSCILVLNSNITEEQNVVGVPIKRAVKNGVRLIVIDPREVELTRSAHLWLRPAPGTELLLLGGILKSLVEQGLERKEWLAENCEDPTTLHYALDSLEMEQVAQATHVSQEAIAEVARMFGQAEKSAIVYALDNIPAGLHRDCVLALADLALLTGNVGKSGSGIYPMGQGANEQGAWDVGCVPNRLPGGLPWNDEAARQPLERLWGCTLPTSRGSGVGAALEAARESRVRAMLVIGDSANFSNGRLGDGLAALQNLEFLVAHDSFLSPPAQMADVVLPRSTFAEKDGTFTNLERRIQRLKPSIQLKNNESRPESWVICQIAKRMNASGFDYASAADIMEEIAQVSRIYAGVSYQRLEDEAVTIMRTDLETPKPTQLLYTSKEYRGIQWPCVFKGGPTTPVLYAEGFPSGKASPVTPEFQTPDNRPPLEYSAWLAPGRVLLQSEREMQVEGGKLNRIVRDEWVQMNPDDGASWSIAEGDAVEIETPAHRLAGLAKFDESIPPGMVAVTTLFGQLAVELQTSEELDPMSKVPVLDIVPARITKASQGRLEGLT